MAWISDRNWLVAEKIERWIFFPAFVFFPNADIPLSEDAAGVLSVTTLSTALNRRWYSF